MDNFDPGGFRDSGGRGPHCPDLQIEEESTQVIPIRLSPFETPRGMITS